MRMVDSAVLAFSASALYFLSGFCDLHLVGRGTCLNYKYVCIHSYGCFSNQSLLGQKGSTHISHLPFLAGIRSISHTPQNDVQTVLDRTHFW